MDFFQHRYYRLTKNTMCFFGLWPEQSKRVRYVLSMIFLFLGSTVILPVMGAVMRNIDDWDILMECSISLLFAVICISKVFCSAFYSEKMLMMLNHIRTDWQAVANDCDAPILHHYAEQGRTINIVHTNLSMLGTVMCYTTCTLYLMQPIVPKIIDTLLKNGTAPGQFQTPLDYYYIDMQKYYFYIVLHCTVGASLGFYSSMAYNCLFMIFVQHGCGLFAMLGRKLQRIANNERLANGKDVNHAVNKLDMELDHLRLYIDKHLDAIEYVDLIDEIYTWCYFVLMGVNILLISMTGIQILKRSTHREQTIRYLMGNFLCMTHLFIDNYIAQNLMDHSISIRDIILNGEWYNLPLKTQKLLILIIIRCNVPCKLTAGKITTLSIESFGTFMKTAVSYFTILRSV